LRSFQYTRPSSPDCTRGQLEGHQPPGRGTEQRRVWLRPLTSGKRAIRRYACPRRRPVGRDAGAQNAAREPAFRPHGTTAATVPERATGTRPSCAPEVPYGARASGAQVHRTPRWPERPMGFSGHGLEWMTLSRRLAYALHMHDVVASDFVGSLARWSHDGREPPPLGGVRGSGA
jgi:hypothetical protein